MLFSMANRLKAVLPASMSARIDQFLDRFSADQRSAGKTVVSAFSLRVLGAAIAYVSQIILARWMGVFDYGVFVVVYVWITILSQIGNLGFASAVIRFIPEYRATAQIGKLWGILRASRLFALGFATLLAGIGVAGVLLVPGMVEHTYVIPIILGAICLPLFCLTEVQDGIARSFDWSDIAFGPTYIWRPVAVLVAMVVAHELDFPMTAVTAVVSTIIATWAVALIQAWVIARRSRALIPAEPVQYDNRLWMAVALPILFSDGFYVLVTSVDVILMSHFGTPADVAVYYAATKTLALIHFVYYAVRAASGPRFSFHYHAGNTEQLNEMVRTSVRWTFWPSVLVSTIVLAASHFLLFLFGEEFVGGAGVMLILVAGILARASVGPVETLLTMAGHQMTVAFVFAAAFAANVITALVLIPHYGIYGAAGATALAMVVEAVLITIAVRRAFGLKVFVFQINAEDIRRKPDIARTKDATGEAMI